MYEEKWKILSNPKKKKKTNKVKTKNKKRQKIEEKKIGSTKNVTRLCFKIFVCMLTADAVTVVINE